MYRKHSGFTLVELLVSTTILILIMVVLLQMTAQTSATWRNGAAKAEQFQEARKAFETVTRRIADATLNTYWDYYIPPKATNSSLPQPPTDYVRQSDLRFRVVNMSGPDYTSPGTYRPTQGIFFQAPIGMVEETDSTLSNLDDLLNSWGYFVEVDNTSRVPRFLESNYPTRTRARLMEFRQPTEEFDIYSRLATKLQNQLTQATFQPGDIPVRDPVPSASNGKVDPSDDLWFSTAIKLPSTDPNRRVRVLAENILAMVILPRLSPADERARADSAKRNDGTVVDKDRMLLTPDFQYHSKQLSNYNGQPPGAQPEPSYHSIIDPELNPKNQLPPVVQVAMFAIDENSAQRLAEKNRNGDLGLPEMINHPTGSPGPLFADATKLEANPATGTNGDLKLFEDQLIKLGLNYRLFQSNVALRGAKWSRAQVK
jgi:uncharacterized protein (TIGR02599 family)